MGKESRQDGRDAGSLVCRTLSFSADVECFMALPESMPYIRLEFEIEMSVLSSEILWEKRKKVRVKDLRKSSKKDNK